MFYLEKTRVRPGFKGFVIQAPSTFRGFVVQPSKTSFNGFVSQPPSTMGSWYNPYELFTSIIDDMKKVYSDSVPSSKVKEVSNEETSNDYPAVDYGEQYGPAIRSDVVPLNKFELDLQKQMSQSGTGTTPDIARKFATQENTSRIVLSVIVIGTIILAVKQMRMRKTD